MWRLSWGAVWPLWQLEPFQKLQSPPTMQKLGLALAQTVQKICLVFSMPCIRMSGSHEHQQLLMYMCMYHLHAHELILAVGLQAFSQAHN